MSDIDDFLNSNSKNSKVTKKETKRGGTKPRESKSKKEGGALVDDIKNLAVPFAILLAKQGIQSMYDDKKEEVASSSPQNVKKNVNVDKNTKKQDGGECQCQDSMVQDPLLQVAGKGKRTSKKVSKSKKDSKSKTEPKKTHSRKKKGGAEENEQKEENIQKKYSELAERIERFLSKH